jgi:hypothetical protein
VIVDYGDPRQLALSSRRSLSGHSSPPRSILRRGSAISVRDQRK